MDGYDYLIHPYIVGKLDERDFDRIRHIEAECLSHRHRRRRPPHYMHSETLIPSPDHIHHERIIPGEIEYEPTMEDVIESYGYNKINMINLNKVSERIKQETKVLDMINDLEKPLDLIKIMETCPSFSSKFRNLLNEAYSAQLKQDLEISSKLYSYIYGEPPVTPSEESSDNTETIDTSTDDNLNNG